MSEYRVLDLFSAAAGGWSLGMHRAGFKTMAACENVAWRRALYQENNPDVRIYDDVCTLTADRLLRDFGFLPDYVVGSPPCQDISSANTKGKGVEGERSGLYFEAIRIIGESRPRGFALENSANLRTRGADAVLSALEAIGYSVWSFVVGVDEFADSPHERKRSWLIGFDLDQVADASSWELREQPRRIDGTNWASPSFDSLDDPSEHLADAHGLGWHDWRRGRRGGLDLSFSDDSSYAARDGWAERRERGRPVTASGISIEACGDAGLSHPDNKGKLCGAEHAEVGELPALVGDTRNVADTHEEGQEAGLQESSLRQAEKPDDGRCDVGGNDGESIGQMGWGESLGDDFAEPWSGWNGGLAGHLRMDDGLSPWVAGTRIAVGGPKGTSAASLIVEAFGDAVVPQIPEAIGRAILRTEAALRAIYGRTAA